MAKKGIGKAAAEFISDFETEVKYKVGEYTERIDSLGSKVKNLEAVLKENQPAIENYKPHLNAFELLNVYVREERTHFSAEDSKKLNASNFTDGSHYLPLFYGITKAFRELGEKKSKYQEMLHKVRSLNSRNSLLKKENINLQEELNSAKEQYEGLKEEIDSFKLQICLLEYGLKCISELKDEGKDYFAPALEENKESSERLNTIIERTKYELYSTIATDWLMNDYIPLLKRIRETRKNVAQGLEEINKVLLKYE